MASAAILKPIRQLHNCIGVFFAPTVLFFAITGGLQMFGLHESSRGSSYNLPALLMHLSQLHKKGTFHLPLPRSAAPISNKNDLSKAEGQRADSRGSIQVSSAPKSISALPMKIFFAATAVALASSTLTGVVMAWRYARRKASVGALLLAGTVVPLVLLLF